jgi:putative DNA primase/helicase
MSATENFRAAMRAEGLDYAGPIQAEGRLHRFKAESDHARNSWYVLHDGTPAAGAFGCWKRGFKKTWCDRDGSLSPAEWQAVRQRWEAAEREREQSETARHAKGRSMAAWIFKRSQPARPQHLYLSQKGVKIFGDLREWRGALGLPLRDAQGELHSLQFIRADGSKRFLTGGRIADCCFTLADKPDGALVLCEGYATGASIHEAIGVAVVCAMHAGNLKSVATSLREKFPGREIIIAADNDQFTAGNPGLTKATEAARAIRAKLAAPQFQDVSSRPTDFNDLHRLDGLPEVARQIQSAAQLVTVSTAPDLHAAPPKRVSKPAIELPEESDELEAEPFPLDALPPAMATIIAAVSRTERVPLALPAVCALGVGSAAIGAGLEVTSGPNRATRANLYLLASAESGSGKSETFRLIAAPLVDHQARLLETWRQKTSPQLQSEIRVLDKEIAALERKAAKSGDPMERERLRGELEYKLARKDEMTARAAMPCIIAQDVTTERLAVLLRDNREVVFSSSPDARKLVDNLMGRYNPGKTTDESLYLQAYSGDFVRVDRQGRDAVVLNKPCLALCWFVQPDLPATMLDEQSLSVSGFLPRLLICHTNAAPRRIEGEEQILSESVRDQWTQLVGDLLATFHAADKPHVITPTPAAVAVFTDFHNSIVDRRAVDLADVGAFAARYAENAWRLAVVLHAAQWAGDAGSESLTAETAANAVRVVEWFAASQLDILAKGRLAAAAKVQDEVLELLETTRQHKSLAFITAREVHRARITATADAAKALLARMEADGLLVAEDIAPAHGGKTTRIYRAVKNPVPG